MTVYPEWVYAIVGPLVSGMFLFIVNYYLGYYSRIKRIESKFLEMLFSTDVMRNIIKEIKFNKWDGIANFAIFVSFALIMMYPPEFLKSLYVLVDMMGRILVGSVVALFVSSTLVPKILEGKNSLKYKLIEWTIGMGFTYAVLSLTLIHLIYWLSLASSFDLWLLLLQGFWDYISIGILVFSIYNLRSVYGKEFFYQTMYKEKSKVEVQLVLAGGYKVSGILMEFKPMIKVLEQSDIIDESRIILVPYEQIISFGFTRIHFAEL